MLSVVVGIVPNAAGSSAAPEHDATALIGAPVNAEARVSATLDPTLPLDMRPTPARFEPSPAALEVTVDGVRIPHEVLALSVLPGAMLDVEAPADATLRHAAGSVLQVDAGRWTFTAPDTPGAWALRVEQGGAQVHLNLLVLHPQTAVQGGSLGGFRIGQYREAPLRGDPAYLPPQGFVEVPAELQGLRVSPHFTLGQFLCKQPGEPAFLALSTPLLLKLEAVVGELNRRGIETPGLAVMSGFRTPWYNRAIGNTTDYSRHLWGDAADVYVDRDGDGDMDDLNGDGRRDLADARVLAAAVEAVEQGAETHAHIQPGGLGLYRRNSAHGPFVHVDARGRAARW